MNVSQSNGTISTHNPVNNFNQLVTIPSQLYNDQFQGILFLGCGKVWGKRYLAAEVFGAGASHHSMNFTARALRSIPPTDTISLTVSDVSLTCSTWQYGLDLRPGLMLTPLTLAYGRVGISTATVTMDYSGSTFFQQLGVARSLLIDNTSKQQQKPAFRIGVGIEQVLTSKLHLRADYTFTNFGSVSLNHTVSGLDIDGDPVTFTNNLSSRLQNNAIVVGLSYYFH